MIIAIFTPHGGCPERCRFCDQKVSGGTPVAVRSVRNTIEAHLNTHRGPKLPQVAFYGGTFTAMPRERQLAYLETVREYQARGQVGALRLSTRPDCLDPEWLTRLKLEFGLRVVELGVQSFDAPVLARLGRSHTPAQVDAAVGLLKKLGLEACLHLMLGCPGESVSADETLLREVLRLSPDAVRLHPLLVIDGTGLADDYKQGSFIPLELEQAVGRAAWVVDKLERHGIRVTRIGLQPNELLGARVVAGPYHPAFGELVRGRLWRDRLESRIQALLDAAPGPHMGKLALELPPRLRSQVVGPKRSNLEWLKQRFKLSSIELTMIRDRPLDEDRNAGGEPQIQMRLCDAPGTSQRGQVQPA